MRYTAKIFIMIKHSLEECLDYCRSYSLYVRWLRYMSPLDKYLYNYFIDDWDNALDEARHIGDQKSLMISFYRMQTFLQSHHNVYSFYNICFLHTILLVGGEKN